MTLKVKPSPTTERDRIIAWTTRHEWLFHVIKTDGRCEVNHHLLADIIEDIGKGRHR